VLAGVERGERDLRVMLRGGRDAHGVDVVPLDDSLPTGRPINRAPADCRPRPLLGRVRDGDELGRLELLECLDVVGAHLACADDGDAELRQSRTHLGQNRSARGSPPQLAGGRRRCSYRRGVLESLQGSS
jgi:hypothetical protein